MHPTIKTNKRHSKEIFITRFLLSNQVKECRQDLVWAIGGTSGTIENNKKVKLVAEPKSGDCPEGFITSNIGQRKPSLSFVPMCLDAHTNQLLMLHCYKLVAHLKL